MSKFFKVRTRSVINSDLMVSAENEAEAKAKSAAAMYTFLEDDMLFENDMELTGEEIRDVMIPDCEQVDAGDPPISPYPYEDDYDPPEYFSD